MWNLPLARRGCGLKVFAEGKELPDDDDDDVVRRGSINRKLGFYRAEKGIHSHLPTSEAPVPSTQRASSCGTATPFCFGKRAETVAFLRSIVKFRCAKPTQNEAAVGKTQLNGFRCK
jgi:hypothetical protein